MGANPETSAANPSTMNAPRNGSSKYIYRWFDLFDRQKVDRMDYVNDHLHLKDGRVFTCTRDGQIKIVKLSMSEFFKELSIEECRARIPERYTVLEGAPRLDSRGFPYREYDHFMRPLSDDGFGETAWPQLVVGEPDDTAAAMFSAFFGMLNTFLMRNDFNTIEFRVVPEVATSCDRSVMRFYTRLSAYRRMP